MRLVSVAPALMVITSPVTRVPANWRVEAMNPKLLDELNGPESTTHVLPLVSVTLKPDVDVHRAPKNSTTVFPAAQSDVSVTVSVDVEPLVMFLVPRSPT